MSYNTHEKIIHTWLKNETHILAFIPFYHFCRSKGYRGWNKFFEIPHRFSRGLRKNPQHILENSIRNFDISENLPQIFHFKIFLFLFMAYWVSFRIFKNSMKFHEIPLWNFITNTFVKFCIPGCRRRVNQRRSMALAESNGNRIRVKRLGVWTGDRLPPAASFSSSFILNRP